MSDRSAWWRTGTGVAAWVVLTVAASGAAWAAVDVVGDEADAPAPVALPSSDPFPSVTPETPGATESNETPGSTQTPDTSETPETPETPETLETPQPTTAGETQDGPATGAARTLASSGGTVAVECTGERTVRMLYATPSSGWQISLESRGPDEVEVEFLRGDAEVRVRAECDGASGRHRRRGLTTRRAGHSLHVAAGVEWRETARCLGVSRTVVRHSMGLVLGRWVGSAGSERRRARPVRHVAVGPRSKAPTLHRP